MSDDLTPSAALQTLVLSNSPAPTAPSPPTSAPTTAPPAHAVPVEPHSHSGLSPSEGEQIVRDIRDDLAKGKISQAVADARFNEMHTPLGQRVVPSDIRTEEQKLIDDHFPPAKESEYLLPMYPPGQAPAVIPKAVQAFEANARGWLADAEFPANLGNSLVVNISQVARQTKDMGADQLESYRLVEYEKLQRAHGEQLEARLQAADDMIDWIEARRPGLIGVLASKGVGRNAMIWNLLIGQSERWHARRKGR